MSLCHVNYQGCVLVVAKWEGFGTGTPGHPGRGTVRLEPGPVTNP